MTPELQAKMAVWRQKCADGTATIEEMRDAIRALRDGRQGAAYASAGAKRSKAKAAVNNAQDLLAKLGSL